MRKGGLPVRILTSTRATKQHPRARTTPLKREAASNGHESESIPNGAGSKEVA